MSTAQALLDELPSGPVVSLPEVRKLVGWTRREQSYAVTAGLIRPLPERAGYGGGYQVTRDDAVLILVAAALALAAGVAIVVMIRAIRGAGLDPVALATSMQT
jgi:hypothetical protein